MKRQCLSGLKFSTALVLVMVAIMAFGPVKMKAEDGGKTNPPPFDFTDQYYRDHGIEPARLLQRAGTSTNNVLNWTTCQAGDPAPCPNTDPNRNQTRMLQTTGGFAYDGSLLYYSIMAFIMPNSFTTDSSGVNARQIADQRMAFIFPIRSGPTRVVDPRIR